MGTGKSRLVRLSALLADRYDILDLIGEGGFGAVYRVKNRRLRRLEAVKVLSSHLIEEEDFAVRFEQEARVLASLDHPNIVKIYDFGVAEEVAWFSMQYIEGRSLSMDLALQGQAMEEEEAGRIAVSLLDALEYSHLRGVIHRDIKSENIMLDGHRRPYIMDFGIAKAGDDPIKTRTGMLMGSPAYMSPEQIRGEKVDGRADLYALGTTLYKMLSGVLPFQGDDTISVAMKKMAESPMALSKRRPDISPALEAIVMRAIAREIEGRWNSAGEMRGALEQFLRATERPAPLTANESEAPTVQATSLAATSAGGARLVAPLSAGLGWSGRRLLAPGIAAAVLMVVSGVLVLRSRTTRGVVSSEVAVRTTLPSTPESTPTAQPAMPSPIVPPAVAAEKQATSSRQAIPQRVVSAAVPAAGSAPETAYRYCATIKPTTYRQAAAKEAPKGFSADQGDAFRAPRTDSARIQIEVSLQPPEPREGQPFQITARLVNGGDFDIEIARVDESAIRSPGGFQPVEGFVPPRTVSIGGTLSIFRGGGVMKGGTTYVKEIRVTDSVGDGWETSVRLLPCP